jgi:hypothetical protein
MKTSTICFALATLILTGCVEPLDTADERSEDVAESQSALIDSTKLYPLGDLGRPTNVFTPGQALALSNISSTQIGGEPLSPVGMLGSNLQQLQSAHWAVSRRLATGDLQVVGREELWSPPHLNPTLDPQVLRSAAISRMAALGIPADEVLSVNQKQANMIHSEDMVPRVHSHVTYFDRGFNGIPVRGSHASIIHNRAGNFSKLTLHWRPIAPEATGNQWGTSMTPAQIAARATQVLGQQGLSTRDVELRYAYVPKSLNADGTTTFALKCVAHVAGLDEGQPGGPDRATEIDIDLDP